jgi:pyruvate-ferredoxin/flavodoxin oxidoreductase
MRLTIDKFVEFANELLQKLADDVGKDLADSILNASQKTEEELEAQRDRVEQLKEKLEALDTPVARNLLSIADYLVRKSVWIIGGDGWAYDIGYGGLDHVLASGRDINVLVLDTEVYSNTGGQSSKATPRAAVAKFAANGKDLPKKDLGMMAMSYGYVYVARCAMGASDRQTLTAFREAEAYEGPSLIIAYTHCIAHGINMKKGLEQQDLAVKSGVWPLYRYNPEMAAAGENPLKVDSREPTIPVEDYAYNETRYRMLLQSNEERAEMLMQKAKHDAASRWTLYQQMADMHYTKPEGEA